MEQSTRELEERIPQTIRELEEQRPKTPRIPHSPRQSAKKFVLNGCVKNIIILFSSLSLVGLIVGGVVKLFV